MKLKIIHVPELEKSLIEDHHFPLFNNNLQKGFYCIVVKNLIYILSFHLYDSTCTQKVSM